MTAARKDDGPTVGAVAHLESTQKECPNCHAHKHAVQALRVIQGEQQALSTWRGWPPKRWTLTSWPSL